MTETAFKYIMFRLFDTFQEEGTVSELSMENFQKYWEKFKAYVFQDNMQRLIDGIYEPDAECSRTINRLLTLELEDYLNDFFDEYSNLGYIDEGVINFNIENERVDEDGVIDGVDAMVADIVDTNLLNLQLLPYLNLTSIQKELERVLAVEANIEKALEEKDYSCIELYNYMIYQYFKKLSESSELYLDNRIEIFQRMLAKKGWHRTLDFIEDEVLSNNNLFAENIDVDKYLEGVVFKALFSDCKLCYDKMLSRLMKAYLLQDDMFGFDDVEFESDIVDYEDSIDYDGSAVVSENDLDTPNAEKLNKESIVELKFYYSYINNLAEYSKNSNYSDALMKTKQRLLYALNDVGLLLFFDDYYQELYSQDLVNTCNDVEDFSDYYILSDLFIDDVFSTDECDLNKLKELLFVKTYFDITADERIKESLDKYSSHKNYDLYSHMIESKVSDADKEQVKRLVKEKEEHS